MKQGRVLAASILAVALMAPAGMASARCGDRPADAGAMGAVQAAVAAQCECCGPLPAYVRCLRSVVHRAVRKKSLRTACVPTVKHAAVTACSLTGTTTPCRLCNADTDCPANQFCECPPGTCSKTGGTCVAKPSVCPDYDAPVCACDGSTFPNDCFRQVAGACKAHDGACGASCQTDADCDDGNGCTVDRCVNGACEHVCICADPTSGSACCGPGPLCVTTTTTTTLPTGGCTTDADCNDGNACTADRCINGMCEHACVCLDPTGAASCCSGPAALCVQPCGLDASGVCGGQCPTATDVCTPSATGCICMPAPPACGETYPTCGGSCPAGTLCATDTSTCHCVPEGPPSCGDSFPACGGTCPVGMTCTSLTGAPECQCVPGPCQPGSGTFFYTCGDPVCSGHRTQPGVLPCAASQQAGAACTCLGQECDPGDACNRLLECATSDPTHGGVCPL